MSRLTMAEIKRLNDESTVRKGDRVVVVRGVGSPARRIGHRGLVTSVNDGSRPAVLCVRFDDDDGTAWFQPYQLRALNLIERIGELTDG